MANRKKELQNAADSGKKMTDKSALKKEAEEAIKNNIKPASPEVEAMKPNIKDTPKRSSEVAGKAAYEAAKNDPIGAEIDKIAIGKELAKSARKAGDQVTGNIGADIHNILEDKNTINKGISNKMPTTQAHETAQVEKQPVEKQADTIQRAEERVEEPVEQQVDKYQDIYDKYLNDYSPKNGADYLKQLWSQGKGGKAAAVGNVLGNLLGAVGKGAVGQDYNTDWQTYKDNYIKTQNERQQRIFNDNMDIVKQARTNEQARKDLNADIENMIQNGNLSAEQLQFIRNYQNAQNPPKGWDMLLSSIMADPEGTVGLFSNVTTGIGKGLWNSIIGAKK